MKLKIRISHIFGKKNYKMKNQIKLLLILSLAIFPFFTSQAQNVDEIVAKHIEAVGGKDNWSKIKSMKTEGVIKQQGMDIKITIMQIDQKAQRYNISLMGMTGYTIITTTEGWNYMPFQGQTKPEPFTEDDLKNAQDDLYLQDEFITYKDLGKKLEYVGKEDIDGVECFKLKMTDKNNQETTYYIDPSNYYVLKQTSKVKANGQEFENSTTFGDYKKLDEGIVVPMSLISGWGETQITKIEINPTIDEAEFKVTTK